jgi:hypothetical protein
MRRWPVTFMLQKFVNNAKFFCHKLEQYSVASVTRVREKCFGATNSAIRTPVGSYGQPSQEWTGNSIGYLCV